MTEEEWEATSNQSQSMLHTLRILKFNRSTSGNRRLRLFAVACCRYFTHLLPHPALNQAVEIAEEFAEGLRTRRDLQTSFHEVEPMRDVRFFTNLRIEERCAIDMAVSTTHFQAYESAFSMTCSPHPLADVQPARDAEKTICDLFRDIFGNPFRPVAFDAAWRTSTALGIATLMYDSREFNAMPILADALQDAGCEDDAILSHCRDENGIHVRGCWVVDLVLGKQ
jgi:hypothetical protein